MIQPPSPKSKARAGTILLVDDQPDQIKIFKAALDRFFLVKVAIRGEQVVPIAAADEIDLILLDILMPEMDGYEVCRQLKAHPATRKIPVIFLTCKDSQEDESLGLELGAVDFIRKPSSPAVLVARSQNTIAYQRAKQELHQKNKALQQALKIREDVERISHHDIKGPLSAVLGLPEVLLADGVFTEGQQALLRQIEKSGYLILEMLNRSLDLFKMENGSYQLQPEWFDLLDVLQHIVGDLGKQIHPRGIHVEIQDPALSSTPASFYVTGEKMLCYSLFYNLILNAIEASANHETISIHLTTADQVGIVRITNSGEVPEAIRQTFFNKYVTHGKTYGTGLGTYSAQLAARIQGGRVKLDSSQAGQTSVIVSLPRTPVVTAVNPGQTATKGLHILLAEDTEENQLLLATYLAHTAHQLVIVSNGMEALSRVQEEPPFDVVVMDVQMPVMDGITAVRRIRQWEQRVGRTPVPIVILSGQTEAEDNSAILEIGYCQLLAKPIRKQKLLDTLQQIAQRTA
ncbi:MAG: response regulator [Magnetococcales bacterium]|nr:response regulator [Magnetococcales bacterium]